jgi:hypothetical protein
VIQESQPIEPGRIYQVNFEESRFKVKALRAVLVPGWWFCEGLAGGDRLVIPEHALVEVPESKAEA